MKIASIVGESGNQSGHRKGLRFGQFELRDDFAQPLSRRPLTGVEGQRQSKTLGGGFDIATGNDDLPQIVMEFRVVGVGFDGFL